MFLACGPWCSHRASSLLPLPYCTRFSQKYKGRQPSQYCGNELCHSLCTFQLTCPHTARSLLTNSIITTEAFKNLENYKACCDDERSGNVEKPRNPAVLNVFFHSFFCAYFVGTSEISSLLAC